MTLLRTIGKWLDDGWFSRLLVVFQFWFCYHIVDWSMAFGSTALSAVPPRDLLGAAAVIGAVAAVPQALLLLATNKYMEMRAQQPRVIAERRAA